MTVDTSASKAADAGAQRLMIITSEGKNSAITHFASDLVLEGTLAERGKESMLEKVRRAPQLINVQAVERALTASNVR